MTNKWMHQDVFVPITFTVESPQTTPKHWHEHIEIIYVLSGKLSVNVKDQNYHLLEDQLLLINSYDLHSYTASQCQIVSFKINLNAYNNPLIYEVPLRFDCNSSTAQDQEAFYSLKKMLALIVKDSANETNGQVILNYSYAYALLYQLINTFSVNVELSDSNENAIIMKRFEEILKYINENSTLPLQQKDIAERFFLSVPYLSKIFKDFVGVGFKDYINGIRLSRSIMDLSNLHWSIDFIAEKNGFPNARSFVTTFKEKYGLLPSEYRKQLSPKLENSDDISPLQKIKSDFMHHNHLSPLAKYLDDESLYFLKKQSNVKLEEITPVSVKQKGFLLKHTYKNTTSIGKAKHILYSENQKMLIELQKDIGFRFIKFHGILDDDMMVYSENSDGEPELNFTYIDMVIDFLLSINLRPFIQLSFMPKELAASTKHTVFHLASIISLPKDYQKWFYLVRHLVIHLENRYSSDEVEQWPFSLWNEPESPVNMFGFESQTDFFHFYQLTYDTIKACNPNIQFGAPSVITTTIEDGTWITQFLTFCKRNSCIPEFLNYHFYPLTIENDLTTDLHAQNHVILRSSADAFKESIYTVLDNAKKLEWNIPKIYITEWNFSISYRELLNDTAYKGCYIIKNILENYDRMESFGYWSLSDFIEEVKMSGNLFHGGMGLFTYNGIKKSPYFAFKLLNKLGDNLIGKGDGYFITKKKTTYQIILYNYVHFSSLYATGELFDMTFTHRYTPFPNSTNKKFILPLTDLPANYYILTDTILNRQHGSAFDKWIELGAMPLETLDELEYVKSISIPFIKKQRQEVINGHLTISRELEPHEIRLIEIHSDTSY